MIGRAEAGGITPLISGQQKRGREKSSFPVPLVTFGSEPLRHEPPTLVEPADPKRPYHPLAHLRRPRRNTPGEESEGNPELHRYYKMIVDGLRAQHLPEEEVISILYEIATGNAEPLTDEKVNISHVLGTDTHPTDAHKRPWLPDERKK